MLFLFTIKTFVFYSLFFLFIESDRNVLLNILDVNIHELFCRNEILCEMSSLSCRNCESEDQNSLKLNDIDKMYVFIDLLTKCDEFEQSIWKIMIYELSSDFIRYFLFESINFCSLVSFEFFNKIQKLRKKACKFVILLLKFFKFCSSTVLVIYVVICSF